MSMQQARDSTLSCLNELEFREWQSPQMMLLWVTFSPWAPKLPTSPGFPLSPWGKLKIEEKIFIWLPPQQNNVELFHSFKETIEMINLRCIDKHDRKYLDIYKVHNQYSWSWVLPTFRIHFAPSTGQSELAIFYNVSDCFGASECSTKPLNAPASLWMLHERWNVKR